jgi:hypothetical protein
VTRIIGFVLLAFAVWYLLTDPDGAATLVHGAFSWLQHAAGSLSTFVSHL